MKTVDTLLQENPNLVEAVRILIDGARRDRDYITLQKWDGFRRKEHEEGTGLPSEREEIVNYIRKWSISLREEADREKQLHGKISVDYQIGTITANIIEDLAFAIENKHDQDCKHMKE